MKHTGMRNVLVGLVALTLCEACANIGRPDGGMKDWDPPVYLSSTPRNYQTKFNKQKLEINFDEIVVVDNPSEKVVISPPQKEKESVKSYGKKVVVRLRDTLKENTTYTIDFSDAIQDNNEKNPLLDFALSFSTGESIDSMQFSGRVLSAYNLEPITGCLVGIYPIEEVDTIGERDTLAMDTLADLLQRADTSIRDTILVDSLNVSDSINEPIDTLKYTDTTFTTTPFIRVTRTDKEGKFTLRNAKRGKYKIFALKDGNRNFYYDLPTEDIAFLDSVYIPSMSVSGIMDTIYTKDGRIDSILDGRTFHFTPANILLFLFNEEYQNLYLEKYERTEQWKLSLTFSTLTDHKPVLSPINFTPNDSLWYILQEIRDRKKEADSHILAAENASSSGKNTDNLPKTTYTYWLSDSLVYKKDTLLIAVDYLHTDSLKELSWTRDTLKFRYTAPPAPKESKKKKKKKQEVEDTLPKPPELKFIELEKKPSGKVELSDPAVFVWKEPIVQYDNNAIHLEIKKDSLFFPIEGKISFDTIDRVTFSILPKEDWKDGVAYRIVWDSASVYGCLGLFNKREQCEFSTNTIDAYGNLFLTIKGVERNAFVELLDKNDKAVLQSPVKGGGNCEFWYVKPDKYYLRLILDENGDNQWNTGNYKEKKQPERVIYYNDVLDLRANWDVEQSWDIHDLAPYEQKPLDIVKNKPKEETTKQ